VKWTKEGLLEHIVELVVVEDKVWFLFSSWIHFWACQAFTIVDKAPFRRTLEYQCPQTSESDIPHHTKLQEESMLKTEEAKECIAEEFKV
jgi:hypothetical protein